MTPAVDLLDRLAAAGIEVHADPAGFLRVSAATEAMDEAAELLAAVPEHKPALVDWLAHQLVDVRDVAICECGSIEWWQDSTDRWRCERCDPPPAAFYRLFEIRRRIEDQQRQRRANR